MGGKPSKNAWDETESDTPDVPPQKYRQSPADEAAYSSSIPRKDQSSALPQRPGQISEHDHGSIPEQQPAHYQHYQRHQLSPQQQRPSSDVKVQQQSPYRSQQGRQTSPGVANSNAPVYYNQSPAGYEESPEPAYQTHLYGQQRDNQLPNGYTAKPTATQPERQDHKKSKKSKSSKSKKSKGKSPAKETVDESSRSPQDPGDHPTALGTSTSIPRVVFDRQRFLIEHGVRPNDNIHVDTTQSNEDSGRGSYEKNDDVRVREPSQRREENIVYTPSTKTKNARRPLLYPSALQNDAQSQPSSAAAEPVQLPETETSHSHEVESGDPPEQPIGFVQVLPSEPFRGWNRPQSRGEYGSGSPNFSGYRREMPGSAENRYSYGRERSGSGLPDIDY